MSAPIRAFVGPNGSGKTLAAIACVAVPALEQGRHVWANTEIDHPNAHLITSAQELQKIRDGVVLLDEITSVFPSRSFQTMGPQVQRLLNQLRKVDVEVAWTAPHWQRCDVILREVTQIVTLCRGFFPDKYVRGDDGRRALRDEGGKKIRHVSPWPAYRVFRWTSFDAIEFENFTLNLAQRAQPIRNRYYVRKRHGDHLVYRTLAPVALFGHVDEYGTCVDCGGSRKRPPCRCRPAGDSEARSAESPQPERIGVGVLGSLDPNGSGS